MLSRRGATGLLSLVMAVISAAPSAALPPGLEHAGRDTVIDLRVADAGDRIAFTDEGALDLSCVLDEKQATRSFALRLSGVAPEGGWLIEINGRPLESLPVRSPEGLWHQIPPGLLSAGENTLVISAPTGEALGLTEVECVSLVDTAEEAHFNRAFAGPIVMVQPPTDPSQDQMDVLHCDLALVLDMTSTNIPSGELTLTARNLGPGALSQCVLDFDDNGGASRY